ncbi:LysR family transcriptional regulator [Mycolicibacterium wolinskyi]|uniref:Probable hydrogen peroxide-inducible genes activator n=1 Tax=Mycolicibacterium wolinskyi TaxID=59750 RepID=A0A132PSH2_9MYCO|nr:LysR substrate-binding domain-containing protein [Mycolicibacterium wolinskyi]KWX25296.1 LysR family transcriptional regulator [Mycolicibacterium wolinskyi]
MELRTLRYFLAVAEERHFGRAAARIPVAQPALSQQILALEVALGVKLFDRSTRHVEITAAGRRLVEHARRIVEAADRARAEMTAFAEGKVGQVSVGLVGTATYDLLPRLTRLVRTELPGVDLQVRGELLSPQLLDSLEAGTVDLALVRPLSAEEPVAAPPAGGRGIVLERLRTEELLVVLPSTHPLAGYNVVDLSELRDETFIVHPSSARSFMHHHVLNVCARAGFRPALLEVSETATLAVTVAAGLGVAIAPEPVRTLGLDGVAYRRLRHRETVDLLLASRSSPTAPAITAVAAVIRRLAHATDRAPL